jgi:hypothetical protein
VEVAAPQKEAPVTFSAGSGNPALQPDILIVCFVRETAADAVRSFGNPEYASGTAKWYKARCEGEK